MREIADIIVQTIKERDKEETKTRSIERVKALCEKYPLYQD